MLVCFWIMRFWLTQIWIATFVSKFGLQFDHVMYVLSNLLADL